MRCSRGPPLTLAARILSRKGRHRLRVSVGSLPFPIHPCQPTFHAPPRAGSWIRRHGAAAGVFAQRRRWRFHRSDAAGLGGPRRGRMPTAALARSHHFQQQGCHAAVRGNLRLPAPPNHAGAGFRALRQPATGVRRSCAAARGATPPCRCRHRRRRR